MTEAEWLACTSPESLLSFIKGKVSDRKLRLVACACFRRIRHLLDGWSQNMIEVAERYVDGSMSQAALTFADTLHADVILGSKPYTARRIGANVAHTMIHGAAWPLAWNTVSEVRRAIRADSPKADTHQEAEWQAAVAKDIFGNPFHRVALDPAWLTLAVVKAAQTLYDARAFDRLPTLADALEQAGCTNTEMLAHCRSAGPHGRGCWAVDLLLEKA